MLRGSAIGGGLKLSPRQIFYAIGLLVLIAFLFLRINEVPSEKNWILEFTKERLSQ